MRHPVALSNLDIFQNFQTRIRLSVHQFDSTLEELSATILSRRRRETVAYVFRRTTENDSVFRSELRMRVSMVNSVDLEITFWRTVLLFFFAAFPNL